VQHLTGAALIGDFEMKRALVLLLCIMLLVSSCAKNNQDKKAKITIWHDKEDSVIAILEEALSPLKDEIEIVFEKKSSLTESLKLVGNDIRNAPDMYIFAHDKIGVYAEMGILAPITDFVSKEELGKNIPLTVEAGLYKGTNYQMPLYYETLLFLYNRKYMKEQDIPSTTEELYSYMQKKTKYGHYGFVEQHSTPYYAAGWIHGFGADLADKEGNPLFATADMKKALSYHKKFVSLMPGETEYATVNTLFLEGMAHSTMNGPWFISAVKNSGIDVGVAPLPIVDETALPISPYCGIQGIHVLKAHANEKKDEITKVLHSLQNANLEISLALATGCAPALSECYEDERIRSNEVVMAMKDTASKAVPMPNMPELDVLWSVMGNLLTDINMRNVNVETACSNAQEKALDLIKAMR
jgi:arabinogalactan oligomer/maltooligosaccharide transport system substrate-binding protein